MVLFKKRLRFSPSRLQWWIMGVSSVIVLCVACLVYLYYPTVIMLRQTRLLLAEPSAVQLERWEAQVERVIPLHQQRESTFESYTNWRNNEPWRLLPVLTVTLMEYQHTEAPFTTTVEDDAYFVEGQSYLIKEGQHGVSVLHSRIVQYAHNPPLIIPVPAREVEPSQEQIVRNGRQSAQVISDELQRTARQAHKKFKLDSVVWKVEQSQVTDKVTVGLVIIERTDCKKKYSSPLTYAPATHRYTIVELAKIAKAGCDDGSVGVLTCTNCWLAPVSKKHSLPKEYAPAVVPTNLPGGRSLTAETVTALRRLMKAASDNNISMYITSGYRSYRDQQVIFTAYIQSEKAKGATQQEAEERANRYSAKPGQSEHQLGTTFDVRCSSCKKFGTDGDSRTMYNYLMENAHRYGFVMSYPAGKESLTGYQYEPWHWRYIGVTRATELFQKGYLLRGNSWYLLRYLTEKGEY